MCRSQAPSAAEIEAALPLLHKVPYSLHSSYSELESFVAHLRPAAIVPIVKKYYDSRYPIDPNVHFKHLLGRAMPVGAQQHGQTCDRGRKRKVQGRAKREAGANEKGDWCWQHGKWQVCFCCVLPCTFLLCHSSDVLQAQGALHSAVPITLLTNQHSLPTCLELHNPEVPATDMITCMTLFQHKLIAP